MKIAVVVNEFPCLSQTFILNHITGMIEKGHGVRIIARQRSRESAVHPDVERYHLLERTSYLVVPHAKFIRLIRALKLVIAHLSKLKVLLRSLNVFRYGKDALSLKLFYTATPFLEDHDIIHCHFGPNGNLGALIKKLGISSKIVTTFHGYDVSSYIKTNGKHVYDELFAAGDLFLCISESMKKTLLGLGCNERKTLVHRIGVDTAKFHFMRATGHSNGKVKILSVARLVEKKGIHYGIEAVALLLKKYPNIDYAIVGDGPWRGELARLIERLQVGGRVKLLGWKKQNEILELFQEADVLLAPSATSADGDQEGIPVVIMEALASGLPVVATRHAGIPELVQDGASGLLAIEGDPHSLAEKLEYFIEHPERRLEMGKRGREHVERYHNVRNLNEELVQLYERLLRNDPVIQHSHTGRIDCGALV